MTTETAPAPATQRRTNHASFVIIVLLLVVIAGGLLLFHERPSPRQWLGVLGAITGLILLGLGR